MPALSVNGDELVKNMAPMHGVRGLPRGAVIVAEDAATRAEYGGVRVGAQRNGDEARNNATGAGKDEFEWPDDVF